MLPRGMPGVTGYEDALVPQGRLAMACTSSVDVGSEEIARERGRGPRDARAVLGFYGVLRKNRILSKRDPPRESYLVGVSSLYGILQKSHISLEFLVPVTVDRGSQCFVSTRYDASDVNRSTMSHCVEVRSL